MYQFTQQKQLNCPRTISDVRITVFGPAIFLLPFKHNLIFFSWPPPPFILGMHDNNEEKNVLFEKN